MSEMVLVDTSCYIWADNHVAANKPQYYQFMCDFMDYLDMIDDNNVATFCSKEMIAIQLERVPMDLLIQEFGEPNDFITIIYSHLSKALSVHDLTGLDDIYFISHNPKMLIYERYPEIDHEIDVMLIKAHVATDDIAFLTHKCFWSSDNKIFSIASEHYNKELNVLIGIKDLSTFISEMKRTFEPSPKHMKGGFGSLLEIDIIQAQTLLDTAIAVGGNSQALYSSYNHAGKLVCLEFRPHLKNKYHGYPIDEREVPAAIKLALKPVEL